MTFVKIAVVGCLMALLMMACGNGGDYIPKPRTYPRVFYPEKAYQPFDASYCNFTFEQPKYAQIVQDADFFGEEPPSECWFDIYFPAFNGKIHCSYIPIDKKKNTLTKLVDDSYKLAFKHTSKASSIGEEAIYRPDNNVFGIVFPLEGSVASPYQFFVTDSTTHYLRGSLYFNTTPNPDSLMPVVNFVKEDLYHMLETFEWN